MEICLANFCFIDVSIHVHRDPENISSVSLKIQNFAHFSHVSLGIYPRSRRGAERIMKGEGCWSRAPKTALERSDLTEKFQFRESHTETETKQSLLTKSPSPRRKGSYIFCIFIYLFIFSKTVRFIPLRIYRLSRTNCPTVRRRPRSPPPFPPPPSPLPFDQNQPPTSFQTPPSPHRLFDLQDSLDERIHLLPQLSDFVPLRNGFYSFCAQTD